MAALQQLESAYDALRHDPRFWAELDELLGPVRGPPDAALPGGPPRRRPSRPRPRARRRRRPAPAGRRIPAIRLYLKREDLAHTGAHKINNALGQALLTRRLGKIAGHRRDRRRPARRRDGHGLRAARPAVRRVHGRGGHPAPGAQRAPDARAGRRGPERDQRAPRRSRTPSTRRCATGSRTSRPPTTCSGRAMGPHPYPTIVRDLQRRIGDEAAAQLRAVEGRLPDLALACVGGGSNAIGLLARFIGEPSVRLAVAEAAGDGIETGRHAAAIAGGTPGILHGSPLADAPGPRRPGRRGAQRVGRPRLPGRRPAARGARRGGRLEVGTATDREAVAAMKAVDPDRGHPAGARDRARGRGPAQAPRRARGLGALP